MKLIKWIGTLSLIIIVAFVDLDKGGKLWDLIYYIPNNLIYFFFIYIGFKLNKDLLTQTVLTALSLYYSYELSMDVLNVFNSDLYDEIYSSKNINYVVSLGISIGLLLLPLSKSIIKWFKKKRLNIN